jgi:hypothetical protein
MHFVLLNVSRVCTRRADTPIRLMAVWVLMLTWLWLCSLMGAVIAAPQTAPSAKGDAPQEVGIDVRSSRVSGRLLLGALPYPNGAIASYALELVGATDGADSLALGTYQRGEFSVPVVSGLYAPNYTHLFGAAAPRNANERLQLDVDARSDVQQDIDVHAVQITPAFLHNGQSFPQAAGELAEFYLVPEGAGARIRLGSSNLPGSAVAVLPGTYSVVYEYRSGSAIPLNSHAVVARDVVLMQSGPLPVSVLSTVLETRVTLNGQAFPNSAYDFGTVHLVNPEDGDEVRLGETFSVLPERRVIHGGYELHYRNREANGLVPINPEAVIARGIAVSDSERRVSVDVPMITVAGKFRINSSPPPLSAYQYARIGLRFQGTSALMNLGDTYAQSFGPVRLVAGDYEAIYSHRQGTLLPANTGAVFVEDLGLHSTGSYTLDVPVIHLNLRLSLDGRPFPNDAYDYARIHALRREPATPAGEPVLLGDTLQGPIEVPLLAGDYDFVYAARQYSGGVPANRWARFLVNTPLMQDSTLVHDFRSQRVRVGATLNGLPVSAGASGSAELYVGQSREDRVSIGLLEHLSTPVEVRLLEGNYSAYYALRDAGDLSRLPVNRDAPVRMFVVGAAELFADGFE